LGNTLKRNTRLFKLKKKNRVSTLNLSTKLLTRQYKKGTTQSYCRG